MTEIVRHAAHLLPAQGPIGVFIHHNTLHAFQHKPFEEAVAEASRIFGSQPYLTEEVFQADLRRGRIRREDLETVLSRTPDREILPGRLTRRELRLAMLYPGIMDPDPATLDWDLEEGRFSTLGQREAFSAWIEKLLPLGISSVSPQPPSAWVHSAADEIHPLLIRLCAAFLDQGMAYWPMPLREMGFYEAARELFRHPGYFAPGALAGLSGEFARQATEEFSAVQAAEDVLHALGVPPAHWLEFVETEFLALPGWAGMFHTLEEQPELAEHVRVRVSLMDYLAVRLTLLRVAAKARSAVAAAPSGVSDTAQGPRLAAARFLVAGEAVGLTAAEIAAMPLERVQALYEELEVFDSLARRRVYHLAYERRHERQILLPLAGYRRSVNVKAVRPRPAAQVFFCLDEREESTRRHLEEIDPEVETWAAAGFYGAAIDYAGIDDAHSVALCPVVIKPAHAVREEPAGRHRHVHNQRKALRRLISRAMQSGKRSSRELTRGWIATAVLGVFSVFPLILRVLSPREFAKFREGVNEALAPRPETELSFTRPDEAEIQGLAKGFSIREKADRVGGVLMGAGLTEGFARIVVTLGHGSTSLNNPHESAHDCGACGGRRGGPNGRLFAAMANHPAVRAELAGRGLVIPQDTWFVGGYHDTANDEIDLYDLHRVPASHQADLARLRKSLDRARALDAHERARRFEYARPKASAEEALRHVQERSEHLAEPRPEYGHCTNAVCIVGRREITRGLFFDRRAFLVSYNAAKDPQDEFLGRQLGAAIPVCAGISLEYYFSVVDNEVYGCGTKLPHNVTGLVGVMNGGASDLRTGLPWQMVEIHEPVRVLFVIETTPDRLIKTIDASPLLREFTRNEWIRLSTIDPVTGAIHVFREGTFEPLEGEQLDIPEAASSLQWYSGRREHLPVARITGGIAEAA